MIMIDTILASNISKSNDEIADEQLKQNWTGYTGDGIRLVIQKN